MEQVTQFPSETEVPSLGIEHIKNIFSADFEVVHPIQKDAAGKFVGTGLFITLAGPEHPDRKRLALNATRAVRSALSKKMAAGERAVPDIKDPESDYAEHIETLVQCTLGWHRKDGRPCTPFSTKAVREVYANPESQWLVEQVTRRYYDAELFIKA
jgi:hypothetical protein